MKVIKDLYLDGVTPQQVKRMMDDVINRTPYDKRRYLRIQEYDEDFGNPFAEPTKCLRIILIKD